MNAISPVSQAGLPGIVLSVSCFCFSALLVSIPVSAQLAAAVLDSNTLSAEVLSSNLSLSALKLKSKAVHELIVSSGALEDPRLSYGIAPQSFGDPVPSKFGNALRLRQMVQVSQQIPWPGKLNLRVSAAEAEADISQHNVAEQRLLLISQSRQLWAQCWFVSESIQNNVRHQALLSDLQTVLASQYAAGSGSQSALLQIESALVNAGHQHFVLEQELQRLLAIVNYLLDRPAANPARLTFVAPELPRLPDAAVLLAWMHSSQPELKTLEARSSFALASKRLTEKDDFPDLEFMLGYNEMWDDSAQRLELGISVNIPLNYGRRSARKAAADYAYHSALVDIQDRRRQLESILTQQLSRAEQAAHTIGILQTGLLPIAEQALEIARVAFASAAGDFQEIISAQQHLLETQLMLASAQADHVLAYAEIDRLSGGQFWPLEESR